MNKDSRYTFTYACDHIRSIAGYNKDGTKLSRSDASQIIAEVARVINFTHEALAGKLADAEPAKNREYYNRQAQRLLNCIR